MEKDLVINVNGTEVTLSAHAILEAAISVSRQHYEAVSTRKHRMKGPFDGKLSSPQTLSDNPMEWLQHASKLKQGSSRDEHAQYEIYLKEHESLVKQNAIETYQKKITEALNETHREESKPLWNFKSKSITEAVASLQAGYKQYREFIEECNRALAQLNAYLSYSPPEFDADADYPFLDASNKSEFNEFSAFINIFCDVEHDKIVAKTLSSLLYYLRKIISHITAGEKNNPLLHNNDPRVAALNAYNFIAPELGLAATNQLSQTELDTLAALVKHMEDLNPHQNYQRSELINELISKTSTTEGCFQKKCQREAKCILHHRRELYSLYNAVLFVREIEKQEKFPFARCKNDIERLKKHMKLVNEILSTDKELKNGKKQKDHYPIQGPKKYSTFLSLMARTGFTVASKDELAVADLLDEFSKYQTASCIDLDCCEYLTFADKILEQLPRPVADHHDPRYEYFQVGNRVLGINNHGDRYIYDFGSAHAFCVDLVKQVKTIKENTLADIKWLFKFNFFQICDINEQDSASLMVEYILTLRKILTRFHQQTSMVYDTFQSRVTAHGITPKRFNRMRLYKKSLDLDAFLNEVVNKTITIQSNYYKLKKVELSALIMVRNSAGNALMEIDFLSQSLADQDESVVTYRAIYRHLPTYNTAQFAADVRDLAQGRCLATCDLDANSKRNKSTSVLTGAWLLAETSRNPMTLSTSSMLVDVMYWEAITGANDKYRIENVLWHADTMGDQHPDGTDLTAIDRSERARNYPFAEGFGGRHPMCHNGSYMKDFSDGELWNVDNELSIVRQKEAGVAIRWLFYMIMRFYPHLKPRVEMIEQRTKKESLFCKFQNDVQWISFQSYAISHQNNPSELGKEILAKLIRPMFLSRMRSFDNLIMPLAKIPRPIPIKRFFITQLASDSNPDQEVRNNFSAMPYNIP